ncbi:MAG: FHA domain-containing protein [Chloroflexia bacterium]|nr:FHA domain-containing protein [Chloroflexia bacterium]
MRRRLAFYARLGWLLVLLLLGCLPLSALVQAQQPTSLSEVQEPAHALVAPEEIADWGKYPLYHVVWGRAVSVTSSIGEPAAAEQILVQSNPPSEQQYQVQWFAGIPAPEIGAWIRVLGPTCSIAPTLPGAGLCLEARVYWDNVEGLPGAWELVVGQRSEELVGLAGVLNGEGLLGLLSPTDGTEMYLESLRESDLVNDFVILRAALLREPGQFALHSLYIRTEGGGYAMKEFATLLPQPTPTPSSPAESPTPRSTEPTSVPRATPTLSTGSGTTTQEVSWLLWGVLIMLLLAVGAVAGWLLWPRFSPWLKSIHLPQLLKRPPQAHPQEAAVEAPPSSEADRPAEEAEVQAGAVPIEVICPHCQAANRPEARFCRQCGQAIPAPAEPADVPALPPAAAGPTTDGGTAILGPSLIAADGKRYPVRYHTTMGRDAGNDIVLDNVTVSAQHAVIRYQQGHFVIEDLNSTNGTFVNGRRVGQNLVQDQARVRLGQVEMIFSAGAGAPPPA